MMSQMIDVERAVRDRYAQAAAAREAALCCPVSYDPQYLRAIPPEVIERDYGCGDPSAYLKPGETVLDLGSGTGKICFIAAQVVGPQGRVIGVDMNDEMLAIARHAAPAVAAATGFANVSFRKAKIQDMSVDREQLDAYLRATPIASEADLARFEEFQRRLAAEQPLIGDGAVDTVVSNCVLNLVTSADKKALFREIHRVLRRGGRAVISDIVSDEPVPDDMQKDPELWSGCISGAFQELDFIKSFEDAGFYGIQVVKRDEQPWQTVQGIEFRSVTVVAYKGKEGACWDHNEALIYKGPFSAVTDDDGHTFRRGERATVCRKTFEIFTKAPYAAHFDAVLPRVPVSDDKATPFPCTGATLRRDPRDTKGADFALTTNAGACAPGESCC